MLYHLSLTDTHIRVLLLAEPTTINRIVKKKEKKTDSTEKKTPKIMYVDSSSRMLCDSCSYSCYQAGDRWIVLTGNMKEAKNPSKMSFDHFLFQSLIFQA